MPCTGVAVASRFLNQRQLPPPRDAGVYVAIAMTLLLYRTPPRHRTHHDLSFLLSSATFKFDLSLVQRAFRKKITSHDAISAKYIVGRGHMDERERLAVSLRQLEAIADAEEVECPESVAVNFAYAMGPLLYDRFISVHCDECGRQYAPRKLSKTKWVVANGDGSGSSGSRLACPNQHFIYANIESVRD
jgi:hypothetical protein